MFRYDQRVLFLDGHKWRSPSEETTNLLISCCVFLEIKRENINKYLTSKAIVIRTTPQRSRNISKYRNRVHRVSSGQQTLVLANTWPVWRTLHSVFKSKHHLVGHSTECPLLHMYTYVSFSLGLLVTWILNLRIAVISYRSFRLQII